MILDNRAVALRRGASGLLSACAIAISAGLYWLFQVLPFQRSNGFSWHNFRNYFPFDQYSYLAIAVNVKNGNAAAVEPFTETGTNNYPRLYYVLLGYIARIFNIDIIVAWQIVGIGFQLVMVSCVSLLLIYLTRNHVVGILGFLPFTIGTFAMFMNGGWYHTLNSHGVLWGPFGVFATLNGESAALSIAISVGCVLIALIFRGSADRGQRAGRIVSRKLSILIIASCAIIGMLANVQTYSFLTATYLLVYITGVFGLLTYGRRRHLILSVALLVVAVAAGPAIAGSAGPLAALVAGASAALPGVWLLFLRYKWTISMGAVALALASAPTIVGTLLGLLNKDPFLIYREVSSNQLGVPFWEGLFAALVPVLFLVLILLAGIRRKNRHWMAFAIGAGIAWSLVASNDLWGANQEPYRFWIDSFAIITVLSFILVVQIGHEAINSGFASRIIGDMRLGGGRESVIVDSHGRKNRGRAGRLGLGILAVLTMTVSIASLTDYPLFASYATRVGTSSFSSPQIEAVKSVTSTLNKEPSSTSLQLNGSGQAQGLVMADACIDVFKFKVITGLPTVFYNLGLAWPTNEPEIRDLLSLTSQGKFDPVLAVSANVRYVLTDSSCAATLESSISGSKVAEDKYTTEGSEAVVTLWQLPE